MCTLTLLLIYCVCKYKEHICSRSVYVCVQLAREAVQCHSQIPHIVVGNHILSHVICFNICED